LSWLKKWKGDYGSEAAIRLLPVLEELPLSQTGSDSTDTLPLHPQHTEKHPTIFKFDYSHRFEVQ
jgi:hypothetical protein